MPRDDIEIRRKREELLNQRGCVVWLTGLSGSGKTTIARALEERMTSDGYLCYVLDGDAIRRGLNSDLGFTAADRKENIRRVSEVAALFADAGVITITAFISPYRADRRRARSLLTGNPFIEVFLNTPLEVCEERDPKNLYRKARNGEISDFTGISAPFEPPENPEITLDTSKKSIVECVSEIREYLVAKGVLSRER